MDAGGVTNGGAQLSKAKFTCAQAKTRVDFPDGADNMLRLIFNISIADVSGPFANGDFTFFVEIPKTYPFHGEPPLHQPEGGRRPLSNVLLWCGRAISAPGVTCLTR
jgi:hypothetical protein